MDEEKHPNRVICPKCGSYGTKRFVMKKCGKPNCTKCPHGPYWYVAHRIGSKVTECYVGKTWPEAKEENQRFNPPVWSPFWGTKPRRYISSKKKRMAFERDNWTCQNPDCGFQGGPDNFENLTIHHNVRGSDKIEDIITLCVECHRKERGNNDA